MAENTEAKEVKTKKAASVKTSTKPKAPAKKATTTAKTTAAKPVTAKKPATRKTKATTADLEQRYRMIEVAAYYIAEKDGFTGNPVDYWIAAELQISKQS